MGELRVSEKSFEITKTEVWEAYRQVKANKGAPGVDEVTLTEFEADLKNNLYKIWNVRNECGEKVIGRCSPVEAMLYGRWRIAGPPGSSYGGWSQTTTCCVG